MKTKSIRIPTRDIMVAVFGEMRRMPGWSLMDRAEQLAAVGRIRQKLGALVKRRAGAPAPQDAGRTAARKPEQGKPANANKRRRPMDQMNIRGL